MEETKPKRYEINSFKELINVVTPENFENLSADFLSWLAYSMIAINELRKSNPKKYAKKTNWEISECSFVWIDDGKNDLKEIRLIDQNTGEVTQVPISKQEGGPHDNF